MPGTPIPALTRRTALLAVLLTVLPLPSPPSVASPPSLPSVSVATPPGLPPIGKWMIDADGLIAHWLGETVDGKRLHEPVNVILLDLGAKDAEDAKRRLLDAAKTAGYPVRFGHSAGYRALIGGALYAQLPQGRDTAFSDRLFELTNNHGRIFGPHRFGTAFVFIGAFSRERVTLMRLPPHRYDSFNRARDDFARQLIDRAGWHSSGTVALGNAMNTAEVTTGDHDGNAVVVRSGE